jgi:hypothetical protein
MSAAVAATPEYSRSDLSLEKLETGVVSLWVASLWVASLWV